VPTRKNISILESGTLFDHLVGAGEQRGRQVEADLPSRTSSNFVGA
jgi:hypothetical protein